MSRRTRSALVALLGAGYLAALVCSATSPAAFVLVALALLAGETVFFSASRIWMPTIVQRTFDNDVRLLVLELLSAFAAVRADPSDAALVVVGLAVAAAVLRALKVRATQLAYARFELKIAWRNLDVRTRRGPFAKNFLTTDHTREGRAEVLVLLLAVGAALVLQRTWVVEAAFGAVAAVRAAVLLYIAGVLRRGRRSDPLARTAQAVKDALRGYDPQVVMFLGGYYELYNTVNVWTPTLDAMRQRAVVVVRDRWHLARIKTERLPVLYLPTERDVAEFLPDSVRLAMYPLNLDRNSDVVHRPNVVDVFVGHGDSDKGSSANPIAKLYDEIWVAGPAAVDRYLRAEAGVDLARMRQVGRPQLAEMERASHGSPADRGLFTVVYAPTWEGPFPEWSYSSLRSGAALVERLAALPGVRVVYKRHHATGTRDPRFRDHERAILEAIDRAGAPHSAVMTLGGLYQAFNEADLLISDVSSVITDFLYSRKPYLVCNPHDQDEEAFHAEFPSTAGARLLPSDLRGLEELVADARGADAMRPKRLEVARYLLGDSEQPPLARFEEAVDDVLRMELARG